MSPVTSQITTGTIPPEPVEPVEDLQNAAIEQWHLPSDRQFDIIFSAVRRSTKIDEQQKAFLIKELADRLTEDTEGLDAARKSAEAAGDIERRGYCWSGYLKLIYKHAMIGAQALLEGERGNAYSRYLQSKYPELA